jgi:D-3-phosphoglycerate dehydrogenase
MSRALITSEFSNQFVSRLEALGYTVTHTGWGVTRHELNAPQLIAALDGAEVLICELEIVNAAVLDASPKLKFVATCRGNPVNVDLDAATARGVVVVNTPGRNADSVADFTIGLMILTARDMARGEMHLRAHGWKVDGELPYFHFRGPELGGKTLGLIGCGAVGRKVAQRVRGFDMHVIGYDPFLKQQPLGDLIRLVSLDELLRQSDFISLHALVTAENHGMIGASQLQLMKPTAYLVNTARAALVSEDALYDALASKRIAGAALDVFWQEPLNPPNRWFDLDNVTLTPHLAGASSDVITHHSAMVVEDLERWRRGERPHRLTNPAVWSRQ